MRNQELTIFYKDKTMEKYYLTHTIKNYECAKNNELRTKIIFNLCQRIADAHSSFLKTGSETLIKKNLSWVVSNYYLKIYRLPKFGETIELATWPSGKTLLSSLRDTIATDEKGNEFFYLTGQFPIINRETLRPVKLADALDNFDYLDEHRFNTSFPIIQLPSKDDFVYDYKVRYDDTDPVGHVNNANYPLWASEAVPQDFRETHEISEMEIAFKKSAVYGDLIRVKTEIIDGNNEIVTLHQICSQQDETIIYSRIKIIWKKI